MKSKTYNFGLFKISFKNKSYIKKFYNCILKKYAMLSVPYKNKKFYKHIVPLGTNCEYCGVFFMENKYTVSSLFNWANVRINLKSFLELLKNPQMIFSEGIYHTESNNMFLCQKFSIYFHGRRKAEDVTNQSEIKKEEEEIKSRVKYLTEKFKSQCTDKDKKLFVLKLDIENKNEAQNYIMSTYNVLNEISLNFDFLVITEEDLYEMCKPLEKNNLFIRKVKKFAPPFEAMNPPDRYGWIKILEEFQFKNVDEKSKITKLKTDLV